MFLVGSKEKNDVQQKLMEKHHEAKIVRRIVFVAFIVLMLTITTVIGGGYYYISNALKPVDAESEHTEEVEIPIGSSGTTIANILEDAGIIHNAKIFRYYVKFKNESGFQAGTYTLSPSMTLDEIILSLKSGRIMRESLFTVTIPEGRQLTQIATILSNRANVDEDEFWETINDEEFVRGMMKMFPNLITEEVFAENVKYPLEGYLFPATYPFYTENPTVEEVVVPMLQKMEEVVAPYYADIEEAGFTVHELLTFASLVEEEATDEIHRKKIASVFYNRLNQGMPLQTDPTVLYALGEHKDRVLYVHLEVDDPYNTYRNTGLTPGPIANAGVSSIEAVLQPEETNYLYFLATPEGEVIFNETYEAHLRDREIHITGRNNN